MASYDGFFLSHSMQKVYIPEDAEAWEFVGQYERRNMYLDPQDVMFVNSLCPTYEHSEMKYQQMIGFKAAEGITEEVFKEYGNRFGRELQTVEMKKSWRPSDQCPSL